jgi:hypothetical protein
MITQTENMSGPIQNKLIELGDFIEIPACNIVGCVQGVEYYRNCDGFIRWSFYIQQDPESEETTYCTGINQGEVYAW